MSIAPDNEDLPPGPGRATPHPSMLLEFIGARGNIELQRDVFINVPFGECIFWAMVYRERRVVLITKCPRHPEVENTYLEVVKGF